MGGGGGGGGEHISTSIGWQQHPISWNMSSLNVSEEHACTW